MRRAHSMPFGAQVEGDGRTRFRLWAPSAREVDLELEGAGAPLAEEVIALGVERPAVPFLQFVVVRMVGIGECGEEALEPGEAAYPSGGCRGVFRRHKL